MKIVLGVSGSIAAYKAVVLVRELQQRGAEVRVVMTPAAARFVAPLTFGTLCRTPAVLDLWDPTSEWAQHVHLGKWADALVVAPATANTLAKMAHGLCEDALGAVYLSAACPVFLAPAMDLDMHAHPATQQNLATLAARPRHFIIESGTGYLASGLMGQGRMAEPADIAAAVTAHLSGTQSANPALPSVNLAGKRVLITAGPTREPLDPVRYITNHSTGKMGIALTAAAQRAGATVTLVLGPTTETPPLGVELIRVETAQEMFQATTTRQAEQDVVIMTAAVADFTPAAVSDQKIKKAPGQQELTLTLVRTPDILAHLGQHKPAHQILVGFALETHNALTHAQDKLERKRLDLCVMNTLEDPGAGFGHTTNRVTLLAPGTAPRPLPLLPKTEVAVHILAAVGERLSS